MFRNSNLRSYNFHHALFDKNGKSLNLPVQTVPQLDCLKAPSGFIANDIEAMFLAQNVQEFNSLLELAKSQADKLHGNTDPNVSDAQLLQTCIPRYCQTPTEVRQFSEVLGNYYQNLSDSNKSKVVENGSAGDSSASSDSDTEPASAPGSES